MYFRSFSVSKTEQLNKKEDTERAIKRETIKMRHREEENEKNIR